MASLHLYDDATARAFEPFALTRPAGELRAGALLVRERWTMALGIPAQGFVGAPHLATFEELEAPPASPAELPAGTLLVNTRCAPALDGIDPDADAWACEGRLAAVRLRDPLPVERLAGGALALEALLPDGARATPIRGWWLDAVWDYVGRLTAMLADDLPRLGHTIEVTRHGATVLGTHPVFVEAGATVEPFVVFDVSAGPIMVRRGAHVLAFTRVVGPCYVGEDSIVTADKVAACSIGEQCRVHGEISTSILVGHANKAHDGFVGHSMLGRWVNLGAGTTTSNLKNTYGTVALWTPAGVVDTGLQFLGTLFGDHAKTGIGLRLTTGSVLGAGANVYDRMPPKAVAPFAWGGAVPYESYDVEKFVQVAARAMARRQVTLGERGAQALRAAHARGAGLRVELARG
ncbi:putative sugar nucleotidyl transferase [Roseisolibacter sp. H3M3-2]|uniref:putative sugar nucleotidyl transferase n=1 Tax=Roseisolibacter sp. H3M3-2 TaxID=3031323 RepID=UPI0023DAF953|nr:putative sugar nucleotidyl transferase [Roseisolibacter sp. H3M3-2]MDF1502527.1 putative sugar nucleotidyl transferase [Roseisolibacter sp. H3M3-2]